MNKDDLFLKNLYTLLDAGYSIDETLHLCQKIQPYSYIEKMISQLKLGFSIEECLMEAPISSLFKEYFSFFKNKNCLSEAIEKSLNICISQRQYKDKMKSKLTYPIILLVFLLLFSIFVICVLMPQVNQMFESFQIKKSVLFECLFLFYYIVPILFIGLIAIFIYMFIELYLALKTKKFKIIEKYLNFPIIKIGLKKYFSLKFTIYYQELLYEDIDNASIIELLNHQLCQSDLKIVLYEINNRLHEGEALEMILSDFEYLDDLFLNFFQMFVKNPAMKDSLTIYMELTYQQFDLWIANFLKYLIPMIYGFVAVFVISIYISIIIPMMNIISNV